MSDVYNPDYYRTGYIEVADFIEDKGFDFFLGNVIKYVSRAGKKEGNSAIMDLNKALWYLRREIAILSSREPREVREKKKELEELKKEREKIKNAVKFIEDSKAEHPELYDDDSYADMCATISLIFDDGDGGFDYPYTEEDFGWHEGKDYDDEEEDIKAKKCRKKCNRKNAKD